MTVATVTQASPLLVRVDGAGTATEALRLSSYTAVVGDRVVVGTLGSRLLVFGKML